MTVQEGLALGKAETTGPRRPAGRGQRIGLGSWLLPAYTLIALVFLLIPIVYTFVFSFNNSVKSNIVWRGFTLDKWLNVDSTQVLNNRFEPVAFL